MKKFIVISVILMCCLVYAIVKLSISENQNMLENQYVYNQAEETQSAKQIDAGSTDETVREEDSGTPATAAQVEAATKVFSEFQSALKSKYYEQAWKLTSESLKSQGSFAKFKEVMASDVGAALVKATIRPESATNIGGRVGLLVAHPSLGEERFFFIHEDGQWKVDP